MPIFFGNQKIKPLDISEIYYGNDLMYKKESPITTGLKFTSKKGDATISYTIKGSISVSIEKSNDGLNWQSWDGNPTIVLEDTVMYVRNTKNILSIDTSNYFKFNITSGEVEASGNIMSMVNYGTVDERCFYEMFSGCTALTTPPDLPATKLAYSCYYKMFEGCTGLKTTPELPAKQLARSCYLNMFEGCTSLETTPELPATDMLMGCYMNMFRDCSGLTSASKIHAYALASDCFNGMFTGCLNLKVKEGGSGNLIFTCQSTTGLTSPTRDMFLGTAGSFTGSPTAGNSYYWYN